MVDTALIGNRTLIEGNVAGGRGGGAAGGGDEREEAGEREGREWVRSWHRVADGW
jgi:hypothetical protein